MKKYITLSILILTLSACVDVVGLDEISLDGLVEASEKTAALREQKNLARQGDSIAGYNLGLAYYDGNGVPQNYEEAIKWFALSAEQGNIDSQVYLGFMYETGQGIPQDYQESAKWYKIAAEHGDIAAQDNLGLMYNEGRGVSQNYQESVKWFKLTAERGSERGQHNLGVRYYYGEGVSQDHVLAYMWFNLALENGSNESAGAIRAVANEISQGQIKQAQYLIQGCKNNNYKNCSKLSRNPPTPTGNFNKGLKAYNSGDHNTALSEFQPLAQKGNAKAQFYMGMMYYQRNTCFRCK